ncbi:MAG: hypothetical protein M1835_005783 [Candelina submexicana]|nr:MAG: hypothetical protein M1835_005783 [Candelina submexicana]
MSSTGAVAGESPPSQSPNPASGGFLSKVTNLFSLSPTAQNSPPTPSNAISGSGFRGRKFGLKPSPRASRNGIIKRESYDTYRGRLRVPTRLQAQRPTSKLIKSARRGKLEGFLGNGEIIPAEEFEQTVNPVTAEIFLDRDVLFETDHLSDDDESMDETLRDSSNLYYIAVNRGELPTYHFWRKNDEEDPMKHLNSTESAKSFAEAVPDAATDVINTTNSGKFAKITNAGKTLPDSGTVGYTWTPGNQKYNPKRSYYPNPQRDIQWGNGGTLAGQAFQTINNGVVEGSRQMGPQPGDDVWERAEAEWERQLRQFGLSAVLEQYKENQPANYKELTNGAMLSPMLKPRRGTDDNTAKLNAVLKTSIPTVAFRLTQQSFGRTASPLKGNEPLVRGEEPKTWDDYVRKDDNLGAQRVYHHVDPLEFLDFYNEKANGNIILRRRKPIPEEYNIRDHQYTPKVAQGNHLDYLDRYTSPKYAYVRTLLQNAAAKYAKRKARPLIGGTSKRPLIYGEYGALFLPDKNYTSFLKVAKRLLASPQYPIDEITKFGVDIRRLGNSDEETEPYEIDTNDDNAKELYQDKIVPNFSRPSFLIRIRRHDADSTRPIDPRIDSSYIKLYNKSIGYFHVYANWSQLEDSEANSQIFVDEAIRFLFPVQTGARKFTLRIPNRPNHEIDVSQPPSTLSPEVQKDFAKLTRLLTKGPLEVEIVENQPDDESDEPGDLPKEVGESRARDSPESVMILKPAGEEKAEFTKPFNQQNFSSTLREQLGINFPTLRTRLPFRVWLSLEDYNNDRNPIILRGDRTQDQVFEQQIEPQIKTENVLVVVQTLPDILVHYGPDRNGRPARLWHMPQTKKRLVEIAGFLFRKNWRNLDKIYVQVARYQREWLSFDSNTSELQFRKDVVDKIDDGEINIYPHDWNREGPFESIQIENRNEQEARNRAIPPALDLNPKESTSHRPNKNQTSNAQQDTQPGLEETLEAENRAAAETANRAKIDGIVTDFQRKNTARTSDESLHRPDGTIGLPVYGPAREPMINSGPDITNGYANVHTAAEVRKLEKENQQLRNLILQRGDDPSSTEVCPFCEEDWTPWDRQRRRNHLERNHVRNDRLEGSQAPRSPKLIRQQCPHQTCPVSFADTETFRTTTDIFDHFRSHINEEQRPQDEQSPQREAANQPSAEVQITGQGPKSKVGRHCPICWTNVTSIGVKVRSLSYPIQNNLFSKYFDSRYALQRKEEHVKKCSLHGVDNFVDFDVEDGKRRKLYVRDNGNDAPWPPAEEPEKAEGKKKDGVKNYKGGNKGRKGPKTDKANPTEREETNTKGSPKALAERPERREGEDGREVTEQAQRREDDKGDKQAKGKNTTKAKTRVTLHVNPPADAPIEEPTKNRKRNREEEDNENEGKKRTKTTRLRLTEPVRPRTRSQTQSPTEASAKAPAKKRGRPRKK